MPLLMVEKVAKIVRVWRVGGYSGNAQKFRDFLFEEYPSDTWSERAGIAQVRKCNSP